MDCTAVHIAMAAIQRAERAEALRSMSGHYQTGNKSGRTYTAEDGRAKRKKVAARRKVKDY
jgi:hypothetical protein